ncbi:MAG: TIGR01212 family radical SAM protein [Anaerovoracaceae bacterium]
MNRIYRISTYLKEVFGEKVVKLSLDGGFTCPNRDGTKGTGGCVFCSAEGSGELASDIKGQMELLSSKWPNVNKYLAYFQSHTSTYDDVSNLRKQYYDALDNQNVVGIVIATRPDCLNDDVLELLSEINEKTFLWVELGLQTIHEKTRQYLNICYPLSDYDIAVDKLNNFKIKYVSHLILGFPGETKEDMEETVRYITSKNIFGIKLHMLNIVKGSQMAITHPTYNSFETIDDYINTICDLLEMIPENVTIHRLTGDVPRPILLTPHWSYKKRTILNGITHELKRRNTKQGCRV